MQKFSVEPLWLYLQSLSTEVWSAFENNFWLLGQWRRAPRYFSFLLSGNYELQIAVEIFPSFLSCCVALQVAVRLL